MAKMLREIPIDSIICREQVRQQFDSEGLEELAATIREHGVQQPIVVRVEGSKYILIVGERRLRASTLAGLTTIPAVIEDKALTAAQILELRLVENIQRMDLSVMERARGIDQLIKEYGETVTGVAKKLGISNGSVSRLSSLLSLPQTIQQRIESGQLSASAAYELSCVENPVQQAELSEQIVAGSLTRDEVARIRKHKSTPADSSKPLSRITAKLGASRSFTVAAPGLTLEGLIKLLEHVLARARQAHGKRFTLSTFRKVLEDQANQ